MIQVLQNFNPLKTRKVVQKVVFPCPCGPWGGQVGDMIDLLYDLFLIWRRPISTGFIRRLAVAQIALVGILFAFDSFDFSDGLKLLDWLAPYWSNYVCLKCAVARERCLGGAVLNIHSNSLQFRATRKLHDNPLGVRLNQLFFFFLLLLLWLWSWSWSWSSLSLVSSVFTGHPPASAWFCARDRWSSWGCAPTSELPTVAVNA